MVNDIKIQPGAPIALAKFDRISIPSAKNIYTWSYDTLTMSEIPMGSFARPAAHAKLSEHVGKELPERRNVL